MMYYFFLAIFIILLFGLYLVVQHTINDERRRRTSKKAPAQPETFPYQRKQYFFTQSEQQFFRILEAQLDHSRFAIFPKVRLGDFVETTNSGNQQWGSWNKIKSRHIDFLIYDTQKGTIAAAIELDGSSHHTHKAQTADTFKNELAETIGLPLKRVKVGTNFAPEIAEILKDL